MSAAAAEGKRGTLDAQLLAQVCAGRGIVRHWQWLAEIESTQEEARRLARIHGTGVLVVADAQSQGRGRLGRSWFSPARAGLWASLVIKPRRSPQEWPAVTALAGLALRGALHSCAGIAAGIKWPNDLLCRGRKIAGILAESTQELGIVLGVGVNISQKREEFPEGLQAVATSVRIEQSAAGRPDKTCARASLLGAFLDEMERRLEQFVVSGPSAMREELRLASLLIGRVVTVSSPGPEAAARNTLRGSVVDIGPCGELLIEPPGGTSSGRGETLAIATGEVTSIEPPLR